MYDRTRKRSMKQLIRDLWEHAAGSAWGNMTEEEEAAEGEWLHELYLRVKQALDG